MGSGTNSKRPTEYRYGMRLRGFSPGAQPKEGFVRREDSSEFWDELVYDRPLSQREIDDYELTNLTKKRKK